MKLQITIIGLGQIGTSLGLALNPYSEKMVRVGHDKSRTTANQAKNLEAVDKVAITLSGSVKKADIVILALPIQEVRSVLEHIAVDLKDGALVMDTSPLKIPVIGWMEKFLPGNVDYVGVTPVINPDYLEDDGFGVDAARSDLFAGSLMGICAGKNTDQKAVNMATQIIGLVGADPFFVDPAEIDGLMARTHLVPRILSSALLEITLNKPGWREGQKLAGKAFARVSQPLTTDDQPGAVASMAVNNKENVVRVINELIRELVSFRDEVEEGNEQRLAERLLSLQKKRDLWRQDRQAGAWSDHKASHDLERSSILGNLLGFRTPKPPKEDEG